MRFPPFLLAATLLASSAAAGPRAAIEAGFDGLVRPGSPLHLRVEFDNAGPEWTGLFRVEELIEGRPSVTWQWPVEIPAQGQRTRFFTIVPAVLGRSPGSTLRAGLVGVGDPVEPSLRFVRGGTGVFVALAITDRGTGFSAVRDALDPPGASQGRVEVQLPAIRPEAAPPEAAAWEAVDAILVDLSAADRLDGPTWTAIRVRVAAGASLVLHGPGPLPELFPDEMVPGLAPRPPVPGRWTEPGAEVEHSATPLELRPGARPVALDGELLPWAATMRFGAGRVTVGSVDLRNLRSPTAQQAPAWAALLGLPRPGLPESIRPIASTPLAVLALPESVRLLASGGLVLLLGLTSLACLAAVVVVRRSGRSQRLLRWAAPFGLLAALPVFTLGSVSRFSEDRAALVVEEHVAALGMTRTTEIVTPPSNRERLEPLPLAGWPPRLEFQSQLAMRPLGATLEGGAEPRGVGLRPMLMPGLSVVSGAWRDAAAPFRVELDAGGARLVRNVSGRDLKEVTVLEGRSYCVLGDLADGQAGSIARLLQLRPESAPAVVLSAAENRLDGLAVAGVVGSKKDGLLGRPLDGLVLAWLGEGS